MKIMLSSDENRSSCGEADLLEEENWKKKKPFL
jgi:hypothetical protein